MSLPTFGDIFAMCKAVTSKMSEKGRSVLLSLTAVASPTGLDEDAEQSREEIAYTAPGLVGRPRRADDEGHMEVVAARTESGLRPLTARDPRIVKARGNVNEGAQSLAGYGGGWVSIDDTADKTGSIITAYAPYDRDEQGTPQKAHCLTMDTTSGNEVVRLVTGDGVDITMFKGKLQLKSPNGQGFVLITNDGVTLSGQVKAVTSLVGGSPTLAKSLALAGPLIGFVKTAAVVLAKLGTAVNGLAPGSVTPEELQALATAAALYSAVTPDYTGPHVRSPKNLGEPGA